MGFLGKKMNVTKEFLVEMMNKGLIIWYDDQVDGGEYVLQKVNTAADIRTGIDNKPPFDKKFFNKSYQAIEEAKKFIGFIEPEKPKVEELPLFYDWAVSIGFDRGLGLEIKNQKITARSSEIAKEAESYAKTYTHPFMDDLKEIGKDKLWEIRYRRINVG